MRTSTRQQNMYFFFIIGPSVSKIFLPCAISEWSKLDPGKRSCPPYDSFHKALLNFIRPTENKVFNIHVQVGTKLLRLRPSHLRECKFRHNVEDAFNLVWSCIIQVETMLHFFLRCQFFNDTAETLMNDLMNLDSSLPTLRQDKLISVLLYRSDTFDNKKNRKILICAVPVIKGSHIFDDCLF